MALVLIVSALALADEAALPSTAVGLGAGLGAALGGSGGGLTGAQAALRVRLGGILAVEPFGAISRHAGSVFLDGDPAVEVPFHERTTTAGGLARVRLARVRRAEVAVVAGASWSVEEEIDVYGDAERYRTYDERTDTLSLLAGAGFEQPLGRRLSLSVDLLTPAWSRSEHSETTTLVEADVEEVTLEEVTASGWAFEPTVRMLLSWYL